MGEGKTIFMDGDSQGGSDFEQVVGQFVHVIGGAGKVLGEQNAATLDRAYEAVGGARGAVQRPFVSLTTYGMIELETVVDFSRHSG